LSDSRQKLLGRFRAVLLNRVRDVRGALADVAVDPGAEELLKRELHTFKGESRMLGLTVQSELAHTLEGRLPLLVAEPTPEREKLRSKMIFAIDAVARSLDEGADAEQIEIELSEAVMALDSDGDLPASAAARAPETASKPASAPEAAPAAAPARPVARGRWTQIEASAIDRLCARMTELSSTYAELQAHAVRVFGVEALAGHRERFLPLVEELERCKSSLDECTVNAWSLRLVAVEPTLVELGRHAESIAKSIGKPIDVRIDAAGVQLESDVLDQLWDSLLHLVQNAVEHGMERPGERGDKSARGTVVISAESTGPSVVLGVEDDGRGIDPDNVRDVAIARGIVPATTVRLSEMELLDVLCRQGFTTKASVTALSGRGVGLDVVRSKVESLGGSVRVESWPGLGTRFQLHVPFAITKERMLVVEAADLLLGIPTRLIRTVVELDRIEEGKRRADVLKYRDEILPLRSLAAVLGLARTEETVALVMDVGGRHWAIAIPRALGERDLIRTPADPLLLRTSPIGATALLEDGRLVFVPQLDHLLKLLRAASDVKRAAVTAARRRRVLVVDDSPVIRDLVTEVLTSVGLEVTIATDGALGLRSVETDEPDLVLSDVEMPNMDGFEMLRQIRTRSQRLPVVMLTTRGSIEDRKRASSLGANAYLVKSEFEGGALVEVIGRFLDLPA
jgi:two-component system chemotaxis sensor kinase CheA